MLSCFRARVARHLLSPDYTSSPSLLIRHACPSASTALGRRHRSGGTTLPKRAELVSSQVRQGYVKPRILNPLPDQSPPKAMPAPSELPNALVQLLLEKVEGWTTSADVSRTFHAFGISEQHQKPLFDAFTAVVHEKKAFASRFWDIRRMQALWEDVASPADTTAHAAISRVFFAFAADPASAPHLKSASPAVLGSIRAIHEAADVSHPHEHYPSARRMRRRIIMHVGPTNSGKTHHALRALAAARSGVYAGPLRLLAHEIWARLNAGQIVPAGVDPDTLPPAMAVPDDQTGFDVAVGSESAVRKDGDPRFARACNMITGEEMRIVEEGAPLLACTIEMMSVEKHVAVAVIDEIQLLGDEQRGGAWTSAVLGVCADEVHLCGEESAVPIVREMLAATGDHLEIRRYERLTPLRVAEKSLNGDLRKVEKGDCVVAFSRTHIFGVKETIEKETGMKCAVAYGALPPEIRSEQAALFNDPDSGYDVLVGSDAVGMGLNLKIKRVVLESVAKWNGRAEVPLSISQIKQIAGRAGRYGLHADADAGGVAVTLREDGMAALRKALAVPMTFIPCAYLDEAHIIDTALVEALPLNAPLTVLFSVLNHVVAPRAPFRMAARMHADPVVQLVDTRGGPLSLSERLNLVRAPIQMRDPRVADGVAHFLRAYRDDLSVRVRRALGPSGLLQHLATVGAMRGGQGPQRVTMATLLPLESLHKLLSLYIWLAFRNPVVWADMEDAAVLKEETEAAMTWCLARLALKRVTGGDGPSRSESVARALRRTTRGQQQHPGRSQRST